MTTSLRSITSLIDMATNRETLETYLALERQGKLNFRIDACVQMNDYTKEFESDPDSLLKDRKKYPGQSCTRNTGGPML